MKRLEHPLTVPPGADIPAAERTKGMGSHTDPDGNLIRFGSPMDE
jgi:hypothetical protein